MQLGIYVHTAEVLLDYDRAGGEKRKGMGQALPFHHILAKTQVKL